MMDIAIEEIGTTGVVHIVTDNGANFKAVGQLMQDRPYLFWTPCATYYIYLVLGDIAKEPEVMNAIVHAWGSFTTITVFSKEGGARWELLRPATIT